MCCCRICYHLESYLSWSFSSFPPFFFLSFCYLGSFGYFGYFCYFWPVFYFYFFSSGFGLGKVFLPYKNMYFIGWASGGVGAGGGVAVTDAMGGLAS